MGNCGIRIVHFVAIRNDYKAIKCIIAQGCGFLGLQELAETGEFIYAR